MIIASQWTPEQEKTYQAIVKMFESDIGSGDTHFHFWLVDRIVTALDWFSSHRYGEPNHPDVEAGIDAMIVDDNYEALKLFAQLVLNRQFGGPDVQGEFPQVELKSREMA